MGYACKLNFKAKWWINNLVMTKLTLNSCPKTQHFFPLRSEYFDLSDVYQQILSEEAI